MTAALLLITLLLISGPVRAESAEFVVKTESSKTLVQFVSEAPLEKIVGRTREVSGKVTLNVSNLKAGASGKITVPLTTLDTGLSLRNEHMRANHLQTKTYPNSDFEVKNIISAEPLDISAGGTAIVIILGELSLHGVTKEYDILGSISYDPAQSVVNVRCQWPISLMEHNIPRPEFLFMRLSDRQDITVDLDFTK